MQKFKPKIEEQRTMKELAQYTFPTFHHCKIDENHLKTHFGYIEKMQENEIIIPVTGRGVVARGAVRVIGYRY